MLSVSAKMKILLILPKILEKQKINFSRSVLFCMKTRVSLKHFVNACSNSSNGSLLEVDLEYSKEL